MDFNCVGHPRKAISPDSPQWPPLSAGHLAPNPRLWLELGAQAWAGWARQQRQQSAHEARLGRAQPRLLDTGMALLWLDKRAPPKEALKGQLDLNPSHPSQPSSAGLWLPLLELRLRQRSALAWAFISGQLYARFTP